MSSTSTASPDPQPASSSTKSPRIPRSSSGRRSGLNPAVRRSSLLLAPSVAAPSAATTTAEHSYVFPSENNTSPGGSPLSQTNDLPPLEAPTSEAAEMALRERKDSEASLKKRTSLLFQSLGPRRPRNMSMDSGSESGNESRAPALASLLETKQKDDASRTTTPVATPPAVVAPNSTPTPIRKLTKDRVDAGSDSEGGGSDTGLAPKKSNAAKRFGQLRGVFGFGFKNRRASDASSVGTPEPPVIPVQAENVISTPPAATEPVEVPRRSSSGGGPGEVQLMSPVMEEFAPEAIAAPPAADEPKPEETIAAKPPTDNALDLSSPPQSPMVDAARTARPPIFSQPTIIDIPPENEASTESDIIHDNEVLVEEPTAMPDGSHSLKPTLKDDDAISALSKMTPISSNADLEHNEDDPQYLTRKYASPPQVESPHAREDSTDGHELGWVDAAIAAAHEHHQNLNNRASFITEDGTIASDSGSDAHQFQPNRVGLSVIAALGEKAKRQLLDEHDEGDADSMQNHRGDEAEEDQRVPATPFIMGFPSASPAVITTQGQGRNIATEAIQELITPPMTPEAPKFPPPMRTRTIPGAFDGVDSKADEEDEKELDIPVKDGKDSTHALIPASTSALEVVRQYANRSQDSNQNPWAASNATTMATEQDRPERPRYPPQASYIEEPPTTCTTESSAEIHPTTEVTKAMHVPIISPVTPTTQTVEAPPPASTSPSPHSPRISLTLPSSPRRQPRAVSGGENSKPGASTTSIQMQPMHSANYGTIDAQDQQPQYPQYNTASSGDSSPTHQVGRSRRPRDEASSNGIPSMVVGFSFKAFVFGLVCGVTLARVGAAAFSVVVLGRRDTRRPRWR
ncbi:hypothetical protein FRB94_003200 [Tulasnella sp. JGI-2019a]|nr:hypothetical protein FRB94_003200 [Tulasnella sp. JGI-2019a]